MYVIEVTPKNIHFKKHIWIEGGIFETLNSAKFQVKQLRKQKMYSQIKTIKLCVNYN